MPNVYYDKANFAVATATPRQWRLRFYIQRDDGKANIVVDEMFPDALSSLVSGGYITMDELRDKLFEVVLWAVRKRYGL